MTLRLCGQHSPCVTFPSPRPVAPSALMHLASGGTGLREGEWTLGEESVKEDMDVNIWSLPSVIAIVLPPPTTPPILTTTNTTTNTARNTELGTCVLP